VLKGVELSDVTPLVPLANLEVLGLSGNQIEDVRPLAGFSELAFLYLDENRIVDIDSLAGMYLIDSPEADFGSPVRDGCATNGH